MEYWQRLRKAVGSRRIIIPGVDSAIIFENKILLVKDADNGNWFLPGGLQELDETIEETARREVREEIGLSLTTSHLISVYSGSKWIRRYQNGDELQTLTFLLQMQVNEDPSKDIVLDSNEVLDWGWFAFDALPDNMQDYARSMCNDVQEFEGNVLLR